MKKIKSVDEIPNLDKRLLCPIQMLPFDFDKADTAQWNGEKDEFSVQGNRLVNAVPDALREHFNFANLIGFAVEDSFFVYDWAWPGKTFEQRYQRLEDKTGAFLRTCGAVVLLNAEHIRLTDLASRRDCEAFVWDMQPDSEPYLLKQR